MEQQMSVQIRLFAIVAISVCTVLALARPAKADLVDKAGWSVRRRPSQASLSLLCGLQERLARVDDRMRLRDVDHLQHLYRAVSRRPSITMPQATLSLSSGTAQYAIDGRVETDQATRTQTFDIDIDADATGLRKIAARLLPVLEGPGPITLSIGATKLTLDLRVGATLSRFKMICLGYR